MYERVVVGRVDGMAEEIDGAKEMIKSFQDKIPGVLSVSVGVNTIENARYNWAVVIRFKDKESRELYRTHPLHKSLGDMYGHILKEATTVEYEID